MTLALGILKWVGIVLGGILGVVLLAAVALFFLAGARLNREYDVQVASIAIPTDEAAVERGKHLVGTVGLRVECHGENLAGDIMEDDPLLFGRLVAPNLTGGKEGWAPVIPTWTTFGLFAMA